MYDIESKHKKKEAEARKKNKRRKAAQMEDNSDADGTDGDYEESDADNDTPEPQITQSSLAAQEGQHSVGEDIEDENDSIGTDETMEKNSHVADDDDNDNQTNQGQLTAAESSNDGAAQEILILEGDNVPESFIPKYWRVFCELSCPAEHSHDQYEPSNAFRNDVSHMTNGPVPNYADFDPDDPKNRDKKNKGAKSRREQQKLDQAQRRFDAKLHTDNVIVDATKAQLIYQALTEENSRLGISICENVLI